MSTDSGQALPNDPLWNQVAERLRTDILSSPLAAGTGWTLRHGESREGRWLGCAD